MPWTDLCEKTKTKMEQLNAKETPQQLIAFVSCMGVVNVNVHSLYTLQESGYTSSLDDEETEAQTEEQLQSEFTLNRQRFVQCYKTNKHHFAATMMLLPQRSILPNCKGCKYLDTRNVHECYYDMVKFELKEIQIICFIKELIKNVNNPNRAKFIEDMLIALHHKRNLSKLFSDNKDFEVIMQKVRYIVGDVSI